MDKELTPKQLIAKCKKRLAALKESNLKAYIAVLARLALRAVVYAPPDSFKKNGSQHCIAVFRCVAMVQVSSNSAASNSAAYASAAYAAYADAAYAAYASVSAASVSAASVSAASDAAYAAYASSVAFAFSADDDAANAVAGGVGVQRSSDISPTLLDAVDQDLDTTDLDITNVGDALRSQPLFNKAPEDWRRQATEFFQQLQTSGLGALADYYQQWMGWNDGVLANPQQTDNKVLIKWVKASDKQWKSQTAALRLIAGRPAASVVGQNVEVERLRQELAQAQQQRGKNDTVNKQQQEHIEQLKLNLQQAEEEKERLLQEKEAREDEVENSAEKAQEKLNASLGDTDSAIEALHSQSKRLLDLGTIGVAVAFVYMLVVGGLAICNGLPDLPNFHNYLAIITPGLVSLVAGSLLLRHDNRLRQRYQALSQQKFQVEFGTGLLTAATELSKVTDLEKLPIIKETFDKISDRYAAGDNPPQQVQQEKEQSMLIEKLVNTIVAAKD